MAKRLSGRWWWRRSQGMLPFEVAVLGSSVVHRRLSEESQATQDTDNEAAVPFGAVIAIVVFVIALILCGCTCFVIRCFAPEVTYGTTWVKPMGVGDSKAPVVQSYAKKSYPGAIPVHDPNTDKYDPNNPAIHRRPANFENPNANHAERQTVLDRLNGRMVPSGNGV